MSTFHAYATPEQLAGLAFCIAEGMLPADAIRSVHAATPAGAELLRLIVRDNVRGAGPIVSDALWANL